MTMTKTLLALACAARLMRSYRTMHAVDRWAITGVSVHGGDVTVHTDLYPKASNKPYFTGACTTLMDWASWVQTVTVEGQDGVGHASWVKGDAFCQTQSL